MNNINLNVCISNQGHLNNLMMDTGVLEIKDQHFLVSEMLHKIVFYR